MKEEELRPTRTFGGLPECGFIEHEMLENSTLTFFLCLAGLAILIFGLSRVSIWLEQRGADRLPFSRSSEAAESQRRKGYDPELWPNRLFMSVSAALVLLSFVAFFWEAGLLEFRGTAGETTLEITLFCRDPHRAPIALVTFFNLDESQIEADLASEDTDLAAACPRTQVRTNRRPRGVISAGIVDAPGDDKQITANFVLKRFGQAQPFLETIIPTVDRLRFDYSESDLLHYVGLGERQASIVISVAAAERPDSLHFSFSRGLLQIRPPEGFEVASCVPSATTSGNDIWNVNLKEYDSAVAVVFKNDQMTRLGHIIDSSIAALVAVGAGGVMSAWLALRIRRSHIERP